MPHVFVNLLFLFFAINVSFVLCYSATQRRVFLPSDPQMMRTWDLNEVEQWLRSLGPGPAEYAEEFKKQYIDGITLVDLSEEDLRVHLGVGEFGTRKLILREISGRLLLDQASSSTTVSPSPPAAAVQESFDCIPISGYKKPTNRPFQLSSQYIEQLTIDDATRIMNKAYYSALT
eukprot:TRINITY_DN1655_c3_g1_i1.p1 TRINITY_DN1655_c3_g1~~TRINITY_DN1655_c3_g1_i1.p1  ORF type:complete len:175 (+),score=11.91 TRINITY_DN1655_c3_g1_i1:166-690(+)